MRVLLGQHRERVPYASVGGEEPLKSLEALNNAKVRAAIFLIVRVSGSGPVRCNIWCFDMRAGRENNLLAVW